MAWNPVQQPTLPITITSGSTTKTANFASNVTSGNLLVVWVYNDQNESWNTVAPTDTRLTSYSKSIERRKTGIGSCYIFYGIAGGNGANTFSITLNGSTGNTFIWLLEFSGNAASTPLDNDNYSDDGGTTSTTALSGIAPATAVSNELAVSWIVPTIGSLSVPVGWTGFIDGTTTGALCVYQVQGSSGATPQVSWTQDSASDWIGLIATFNPSAGASYIYPGLTSPSSSLSGLTAVKRVLRPNITRF